jgi:predicted DsbA family dithiol-disulfide isomerase
MEKKTLQVDIWSDIACPWCYVGKRRFEAALAAFKHASDVTVVWHAFELDPSAPRVRDASVTYAGRLAKKYGMSEERAVGMLRQMTETAAAEGLDFHFEKAQSGNTFDAHRVVHLAAEHGLQDAMKERLLKAYFTEGAAVGEPETLVTLAGEVGLDEEKTRAMLASGDQEREVRADEEHAREMGITGVPFFVIGGRYGVSGAQPKEALLGALEKAWTERKEEAVGATEGATCGPGDRSGSGCLT